MGGKIGVVHAHCLDGPGTSRAGIHLESGPHSITRQLRVDVVQCGHGIDM